MRKLFAGSTLIAHPRYRLLSISELIGGGIASLRILAGRRLLHVASRWCDIIIGHGTFP
jgi:hypothetical protein